MRLDEKCWCSQCKATSAVKLCRHRAPLKGWRVVERTRGRNAPKHVLSVTIGEVTVFTDGSGEPTRARETKLRKTLANRRVTKLELGLDSFGAMALLGVCKQCDTAFFLPDIQNGKRPPRIARVPLRERMTVLMSSSV
jgi:hypothetical protein